MLQRKTVIDLCVSDLSSVKIIKCVFFTTSPVSSFPAILFRMAMAASSSSLSSSTTASSSLSLTFISAVGGDEGPGETGAGEEEDSEDNALPLPLT